jgi:lipopolysaccharide export system protein LptA
MGYLSGMFGKPLATSWLVLGLLLAGAAPAGAQGIAGADADQPIEINADNLEVQQDQNLAVFTGNVEAVQGRIRLNADQIKVWYRPGGAARADAGGTIIRIDALGRVFVSSPTETAQGDVGIYDVPAKQITLTGKVVLTRGDNVIRGERLVLNMATGHSQIEGGRQRVRGLFVPPKKQENAR